MILAVAFPSGSAAAASTAATYAAPASGSGNASGVVSIVIGVVILIVTVRWTILYRRANKPPEAEDAPPVRRLGETDTQWWEKNAGTPSRDPITPAAAVDPDGVDPDVVDPKEVSPAPTATSRAPTATGLAPAATDTGQRQPRSDPTASDRP